jgi:tRNA dimethylallyltransferase
MLDREGAVLIAGPTASGKSALALDLARRLDGTVINADSMQVYRDLRVLTARPTPPEEREVPHRLYGHVDGGVNFSVGRYLLDAAEALAQARRERRLPILVGGTGLYFRALLDGLSDIPAVPAEVRDKVRAAAEGRATPALHDELSARDPATAARLRPNDRLRILRALEVVEATGRSLLAFQGRKRPGLLAHAATVRVFLAPDRAELRRRIDARFVAMVGQGALDEVHALAARRLDPMLPVMRAHGVPGLLAHLSGEMSLDEAIRRGQGDTRRYAKRQFTWFRHQMPGWTWVKPEDSSAAALGLLAHSGRGGPN